MSLHDEEMEKRRARRAAQRAKQLAEHGIPVTLVEKKPSCGGMARNRRCLEEFPIKLICNATITEVFGQKQLEGVALSDGTELPCKCS